MVDLYAYFKDLIEAVSGLDRNVLHVHLGIVLFGLLAWIFPGRGRFAKAWAWLLLIELVNEFFDLMAAVDAGKPPNWPDSIADVINTMLWPAVWCLWWYLRGRRIGQSGRMPRWLQVDPRAREPDPVQPLPGGAQPADRAPVPRAAAPAAATLPPGDVRPNPIGVSSKESPWPR